MIQNIHDLHKEIAKVIKLKIAGVPVLIAEQTNPSFDNWVSFKLTNWSQIGHEISFYDDENPDNSDFTTYTTWKVTLNIVTIGLQSEQMALTLAHNLNKGTFRDSFSVLGLVYLSQNPIRPSPKMVGDGWEQRHILDVNFNITISDTDEIDFVDTIEITNQVIDESGDVILERVDEIDI